MYADILSDLVITDVCTVTTLYTEAGGGASRIRRPRWAILIKSEGETVYTCRGKQYLSNAGNIAILPRGCSYEWKCTKSGHFTSIEFQSEREYDDILTFRVGGCEELLRLAAELEYKLTRRGNLWQMDSKRDLYTIILKLAQSAEKSYIPTEKQKKIEPALQYIAQNYTKDLSNDTLAQIAGMSTVYFRKLFRQVMGISPIAYVHSLRIQKAKEMLKSDYGTISDVAQSLGYPTIYDFSRDFKKHTGIPPSKY